MAYTAIDDPSAHFKVQLYTGNGTAIGSGGLAVTFNDTDTDLQPDLVWIKNRDAADFHVLTDAVRGVTKYIKSNDTTAETTNAESLTGFDADGFTVGDMNEVNTNTEAFVAWNWKAGGSGSANTDGSISTTATSANTTSGVSIVTYTGSGSAGTLGHGIGIVPKTFVVKRLDSTSAWSMYWKALGSDKYIYMNDTAAVATDATSEFWNNTDPTSTVFSVGDADYTNGSSQTYVAYLFADVQGFSKFGSFTGNGDADGPFIYTGFRPAYVLYKVSDGTSDWYIQDTKRLTYNVNNTRLEANNTDAEVTGASDSIDMLSNGFKLRYTSASFNASGATYVYAAFAESPFVNSKGVPTNAR